MSKQKIYAPDGVVGAPMIAPAAVPARSSGLRIAALDNGKPGAAELLAAIGNGLAERLSVSFVGVRQKGSAATPCEPDLLGRLVADADLVLTGTAD